MQQNLSSLFYRFTVRYLPVLFISGAILSTLAYFLYGEQFITAAYEGESLSIINKVMEQNRLQDPEGRTLLFYLGKANTKFIRLLVAGTFIYAIIQFLLLSIIWPPLKNQFRNFFSAKSSPFNLGLFRIIFFWEFFQYALSYGKKTPWFSTLPTELMVPPVGTEYLLKVLPINENLAWVACILFIIFSFTAMIGFFSRFSALMVVPLSFYVLMIPNLFGKVHHYNHLLWFALIFGMSRCGDSLSVDALINAWRRADKGDTRPPEPSNCYALPLRIIWILLGVIYFFPGFFKMLHGGPDWVFSENLKYTMYSQWYALGGFLPFFRIDQYPWLYKFGGLATIVFEMGFIFMIFTPKSRLIGAFGGLAFHFSNHFFLNILYRRVLICYVALFDWAGILKAIGQKVFKKKLQVLYDGNCKLCRRTIATLRSFDLLGGINYSNANEKTQVQATIFRESNPSLYENNMVAATSLDKVSVGYDAYRALAFRIPFLWPILPFLYLWPVPAIGRKFYSHVAQNRSCSLVKAVPQTSLSIPVHPLWKRAFLTVGAGLVLVNVVFGFGYIEHGWPFACYPTFAYIVGPTKKTLDIYVITKDGKEVSIANQKLIKVFDSSRFDRMVWLMTELKDKKELNKRLQALSKVLIQNKFIPNDSVSIKVYQKEVWTDPALSHKAPIERRLILDSPLMDKDLLFSFKRN